MNEKTTMRRIWWFSESEAEQAEQWLSDLAAEGWRIIGNGLCLAKFTRAEPAELRFRCVRNSYYRAPASERNAFIDAYRHTGWQCVDERCRRLVFYRPAGSDDAEETAGERANNLRTCRKQFIWHFVAAAVFAALATYVILTYGMQYVLLTGSGWLLVYLLFALVYLAFGIRGLIEYRRVSGGNGRRGCWENATVRLWRLTHISMGLLILTITLIGAYMHRMPERRPESLTVMRASDIAGDAAYSDDSGLFYIDHSLLFPDQLSRYISSDSGEAELEYKTYRGIAPMLAVLLAQNIARSTAITDMDDIRGIPENTDTRGFDRLWLYDDAGRHLLVAVKDSTVYYMSLQGGYTTDDMLRALLNKIS